MMWGWQGSWGWGGWLLMSVSMVVFWGLVVWTVVWLFRRVDQGRWDPSGSQRPDAEQLLAERFAAGEIDDEEYRRRLETLRSVDRRPGALRR